MSERPKFLPLIEQLKTESLINESFGITLTPFDGSESEKFAEWLSDPDVNKYLSSSDGLTLEEAHLEVKYAVMSSHTIEYRINYKQYGFIGCTSMYDIDLRKKSFTRSMIIGDKNLWGLGIARNAGIMVLDNAKRLGFKKVFASAYKANIASIENIKKRGYKEMPSYPSDKISHFVLDLSTWESPLSSG